MASTVVQSQKLSTSSLSDGGSAGSAAPVVRTMAPRPGERKVVAGKGKGKGRGQGQGKGGLQRISPSPASPTRKTANAKRGVNVKKRHVPHAARRVQQAASGTSEDESSSSEDEDEGKDAEDEDDEGEAAPPMAKAKPRAKQPRANVGAGGGGGPAVVDAEMEAAVVKMQAVARGRQARKKMSEARADRGTTPKQPSANVGAGGGGGPAVVDAEMEAAVVKIQAVARGRQARKKMSEARADRGTAGEPPSPTATAASSNAPTRKSSEATSGTHSPAPPIPTSDAAPGSKPPRTKPRRQPRGRRASNTPASRNGNGSGNAGGKMRGANSSTGQSVRKRSVAGHDTSRKKRGAGRDNSKTSVSKSERERRRQQQRANHPKAKNALLKIMGTPGDRESNAPDIFGLVITVEGAEGLKASNNVVAGGDGEEGTLDVEQMSAMVSLTLGKQSSQTRRKYDTTAPMFNDELFLSCAEEMTTKGSSDSTLVVEVFGNTRIFRRDGRLGNDFLGGAVIDLSQEDITLEPVARTLTLLPSEAFEAVLPKALREKKRYVGKPGGSIKMTESNDAGAKAGGGGPGAAGDGQPMALGTVTLHIQRASDKRTQHNAEKKSHQLEDGDDIQQMLDPFKQRYAVVKKGILSLIRESDAAGVEDLKVWKGLDRVSLGIISVSSLSKWLGETWKLIAKQDVLLRAVSQHLDVTANRRTWVESTAFLPILAKLFAMKRIFDTVPDSLANARKRIEWREFRFMLGRVGYAEESNSVSEAQQWFNNHASSPSKSKDRTRRADSKASKASVASPALGQLTKTVVVPKVTATSASVLLNDAADFIAQSIFWPDEPASIARPEAKSAAPTRGPRRKRPTAKEALGEAPKGKGADKNRSKKRP